MTASRKGLDRAQRKSLSDDERIKIALDRFGPLSHGQRMAEIEALSERYGRDPAVISRAISEAFRKGLVHIRAERSREVSGLEERLKSRFDLLGAIVIQSSPGPSATSEDKKSDDLHAELGGALARRIASGTVFRSGDVIGLGSGRGVFHTVNTLSKLPPLRPKKVTLVSFTGAVFAQDHARTMNMRLDADIHINLFAQCFVHPVEQHQIHSPIVLSDPREFSAVQKRTWLGKEHWKGNTHAMLGVGVLTRGHRFYEYVCPSKEKAAKDDGASNDHTLDAIGDPLQRLVELCKDLTESAYCPVADISNNLFFVSPPAEIKKTVEKETKIAQIKDLIKQINQHLVNIGEAQLQQIQTIMLVAGGVQKACAIRQLLMNENYHIRFLCTDDLTAKEILR